MKQDTRTWRRVALVATLGAGLVAGCSTTPPPNAALAASAASLEAARAAGAAEYASVEWNSARAKLDRARALAQSRDYREATRMAEQADADAQLARARTSAARSQLAVTELESGLSTLREELARNPAAAGGAGTSPGTAGGASTGSSPGPSPRTAPGATPGTSPMPGGAGSMNPASPIAPAASAPR